MKTEKQIIEAMAADEFTFHYQPKISLVTGKVLGAEALIRWVRPGGEVVMPKDFIPLAERSSLITDITRHMFPKLVKDLLVINDIEPQVVSFNASARDFHDGLFTEMVLRALDTSQLDPAGLQVEITETTALESGDRIRHNLLPLHDEGVELAMDDFGTGYSSLDMLSKWPFSTIKLDQGIIGRMLTSDKSATIVNSAIRMGHELGISVLAEGVETRDQHEHLLESGCSSVQGFWVSHALSLGDYIDFVKQDNRWSGLPIGMIHMAIIDHVQWRKQLVSRLLRAVTAPPGSPAHRPFDLPPMSCHECRLGRWYDGYGRAFKDRPSYLALEQPHCELHEIATELVERVGNGATLTDITPGLRALSECSIKVLNLLQSLENEALGELHLSEQGAY
jgi:EAL domain-containing protein (putative c-di-GMP-specific phosphodiesterase class I)